MPENISFSRNLDPVDPSRLDTDSARVLASRERRSGRIWNVTRTLANAPSALQMMDGVWDALARSSLSSGDRELIAMEMAVMNGCHYCVPAHRYTALHEARLGAADIHQLTQVSRGETLPEGMRLAVMQRLVRRLVDTKGGLSDAEFSAFRSQGVTAQQMIETIAEIAHCTVTNFTNRLARTPLDSFLEEYR
ncbi:MAG: carboxymuconolactone decarboxylase family protein [Rhodospirillales bacterium]|nr:carboxymuconolactone decarboxylase family protein [Rhodospirillales bacterium]